MVFYLLAVAPFLDNNIQRSLFAGEICVISFYLVLLLPYISNMNLSIAKQGKLCIMIVLTNVGIGMLFSVASSAIVIYTWIKSRRSRAGKIVLPIVGVIITDYDQEFSKIKPNSD